MRGRVALLAVLAATAFGCGKRADEQQGVVLAFVAASTKDATRAAANLFTKETGVEVKVSDGASSRLAAQIAHDAPADLFLSASEEWADFVKDKGFVAESRLFLANSLVIVVPKENPGHVVRPEDLIRDGVRHVAVAGAPFPAGVYGRQALKKLGLWDALEKKLVPADDVRQALAYVARGEAEAGIVYATDARVTGRVRQVYEFSPSVHDPIRYPLVLLKAGREKESARRFYEFLQSPRAAAVFKEHGFTPLAPK